VIRTLTKTWTFTQAQANLSIVTATGTQRISVTLAKANTAWSVTNQPSIRIGLAASALPGVTNNSATGEAGVFLSSDGIPSGGGEVNANGAAPIATGAAGESVLLTCSAPTAGTLKVVLVYWVDDVS
jgi:hypothetical protein